MSKKKKKLFCIETFDGGAYMKFFTRAKDSKKALRNLQKNSWDFRKIASGDKDLRITVKNI